MANDVEEFNAYRKKMNTKILAENNTVIKRIFNLDTNAFQEGALNTETKELLGLVASAVLRCDDCVRYHLEKCHEEGLSRDTNFGSIEYCNPCWRHHCHPSFKTGV